MPPAAGADGSRSTKPAVDGPSALSRSLDVLMTVVLALAALDVIGIVIVRRGRSPLGSVPITLLAVAVLLAGLAAVALALNGRFGRTARNGARVAVLLGMLLTAAVLPRRWPRSASRVTMTEVVPDQSVFNRLNLDQRLRWGARVMAHAFSTGTPQDSSIEVPKTWLLPPDVHYSILQQSDSVVITASDTGGHRSCRFTLFGPGSLAVRPTRHDPIHCDAGSAKGKAIMIRRSDWHAPPDSEGAAKGPLSDWRQYRRDAARASAAGDGKSPGRGWRAPVEGEIRASASAAGDLIFIGTHGPGALHAFDEGTGQLRWMRYLPNWIHHDAVSDGRTVVVGFGDNNGSLFGDAPSGVSAFSLKTGALIWTSFEGNSVMTSPVIWRDQAVYISSAGAMRMHDLATGAETGRLRVPGRATMAPPALVGDVLVASLDSSLVCAFELQPIAQRWCARMPEAGALGHSAATVIGDRVYVTGGILKQGRPLGVSWETWGKVKILLGLWSYERDFTFTGQRLWALDLVTGRIVWQSKVYPSRFEPAGHISGTPIGSNGTGFVFLPLAGKLVAFDLASGAERWTQDVGPTRGPALQSGDHLFVALRSGELRAIRASTGTIDCSIKTSRTFDRAGPALVDSTLYFGSISGVLMAVPLQMLETCAEDSVRALVR